jgi:hypothetical protein
MLPCKIIYVLINLVSGIYSTYYITEPIQNSSWTVSQSATVHWRIEGEGSASPINVDLLGGKKQQFVAHICLNLPSSSTSCTWNPVPNSLQTLQDGYSVRIEYTDSQNNFKYDYSHQFQIQGISVGDSNNIIVQPPKSW